jgi:predicted phosphodiesterase
MVITKGFGLASLYPPVSRGDSTYFLNPGSVGTTRNGTGYQATYLAFPPAAMEPLSKRTKLPDKILSW